MRRTLLACLILAASPAFADSDEHVIVLEHRHLAAADTAREQGDVWKRWADDFSREMRTSMGTLFAGRVGSTRVVKGAPYSAEVVTESNQALADGNVITRRTSGAIYRDGEGRTRQESGGDGRDRTIYITDPVEAKSFVLTPGAKRAVTTSLAPTHAFAIAHEAKDRALDAARQRKVVRVNSTEVRIEDGKVFVDGQEVRDGSVSLRSKSGKEVRVENGKVFIDGRDVTPPQPPAPPSVAVRTIEAQDSGDGTRREEIRVQVVRSGDDTHPAPPVPPVPPVPGALGPLPPTPPLPPMPGIQTMRFESTARLGRGVTTALGTKEFDGVRAEGKSTVWTIAAGEIGNRNPIHVTSESWYSPDLQITVYSRHSDPRTGESIYRLAGIKRGEPDANLFKVPEDYKLRDRSRK